MVMKQSTTTVLQQYFSFTTVFFNKICAHQSNWKFNTQAYGNKLNETQQKKIKSILKKYYSRSIKSMAAYIGPFGIQ